MGEVLLVPSSKPSVFGEEACVSSFGEESIPRLPNEGRNEALGGWHSDAFVDKRRRCRRAWTLSFRLVVRCFLWYGEGGVDDILILGEVSENGCKIPRAIVHEGRGCAALALWGARAEKVFFVDFCIVNGIIGSVKKLFGEPCGGECLKCGDAHRRRRGRKQLNGRIVLSYAQIKIKGHRGQSAAALRQSN